jgi:uncharacterized protein Yka (UPF0111/DUF47 family)
VSRGKTRWFLPESDDVLATLGEQADVTIRGMDAFARWAAGEAKSDKTVRAAEHEADDRKRDLVTQVRGAFTTPLDPEDLFELSRGLDEVLNAAKNTVREAEALTMAPDQQMADMCELLAEGVQDLGTAFSALGADTQVANAAAAAAIKTQRRLERSYRLAMAELVENDDMREVIGRQELYRRLSAISDGILAVADRIMYAVVKES